jgi:hypothetical protein
MNQIKQIPRQAADARQLFEVLFVMAWSMFWDRTSGAKPPGRRSITAAS